MKPILPKWHRKNIIKDCKTDEKLSEAWTTFCQFSMMHFMNIMKIPPYKAMFCQSLPSTVFVRWSRRNQNTDKDLHCPPCSVKVHPVQYLQKGFTLPPASAGCDDVIIVSSWLTWENVHHCLLSPLTQEIGSDPLDWKFSMENKQTSPFCGCQNIGNIIGYSCLYIRRQGASSFKQKTRRCLLPPSLHNSNAPLSFLFVFFYLIIIVIRLGISHEHHEPRSCKFVLGLAQLVGSNFQELTRIEQIGA